MDVLSVITILQVRNVIQYIENQNFISEFVKNNKLTQNNNSAYNK